MHRKQLNLFFILLLVYALSAFLTYTFFLEGLTMGMNIPTPELPASPLVLGLANAGIILVAYGILGLLGYWFARKLKLPGIFDPQGSWRRWFEIPLGIGFLCGVALIIGDLLLAPINGLGRFPHPDFPVSILFSANLNNQGFSLTPIRLSLINGPVDLFVHVLGVDPNGQPLWSVGGNNPNDSGSIWLYLGEY